MLPVRPACVKPVYNSPPTAHLNFHVGYTIGTGYPPHLHIHKHTFTSESIQTPLNFPQFIVLRLKPIEHLRKALKMAVPIQLGRSSQDLPGRMDCPNPGA